MLSFGFTRACPGLALSIFSIKQVRPFPPVPSLLTAFPLIRRQRNYFNLLGSPQNAGCWGLLG